VSAVAPVLKVWAIMALYSLLVADNCYVKLLISDLEKSNCKLRKALDIECFFAGLTSIIIVFDRRGEGLMEIF
jgi:hypothetical protein